MYGWASSAVSVRWGWSGPATEGISCGSASDNCRQYSCGVQKVDGVQPWCSSPMPPTVDQRDLHSETRPMSAHCYWLQIPQEISKKLGEANLLYATKQYKQAADLMMEVIKVWGKGWLAWKHFDGMQRPETMRVFVGLGAGRVALEWMQADLQTSTPAFTSKAQTATCTPARPPPGPPPPFSLSTGVPQHRGPLPHPGLDL